MVEAFIAYESLTGNTRTAAELIARELEARGVAAVVCDVVALDHAALARADLVLVGSWVDGLVLFGQRPGRAARLEGLPPIDGKICAVFCTYAVAPGSTLAKMSSILEGRGAEVLGGIAIRRGRLEEGARTFVDRVLAAVPV